MRAKDMARTVTEWIGKSDDDPVPPKVRLRVFIRFGGICGICTVKIRAKRWICDHKHALCNGGENRERNLWPIHEACDRKVKTPRDVAEKKNQQPGALEASRDQETKRPTDAGITRQRHQDENRRRMGATMKRPVVQPTKRERLHDILGRFGDDLITREQFEAVMKDHKLTDDDIDQYCRGELK